MEGRRSITRTHTRFGLKRMVGLVFASAFECSDDLSRFPFSQKNEQMRQTNAPSWTNKAIGPLLVEYLSTMGTEKVRSTRIAGSSSSFASLTLFSQH